MARDCPDRGTGGTQTRKAFNMGGGISQPSTDLAPTCTETCYAYGCCEEHFGSVGQTMQSSHAYASNDYDEYLDWCAHNPEDQNVVDYTPDYTEDVGNDYDDDIGNEVPGDITCAGLNSWTTHGHHYGILDGGATSTCGSF